MARAYLVPAPQWWKHLRDWKPVFWHRERKAAKEDTDKQIKDEDDGTLAVGD